MNSVDIHLAISIYICPQEYVESSNLWMVKKQSHVEIWLCGTTCLWHAGNILRQAEWVTLSVRSFHSTSELHFPLRWYHPFPLPLNVGYIASPFSIAVSLICTTVLNLRNRHYSVATAAAQQALFKFTLILNPIFSSDNSETPYRSLKARWTLVHLSRWTLLITVISRTKSHLK